MYPGPFAQFSPFAPTSNPFFFHPTYYPAFAAPNFGPGFNSGFTPSIGAFPASFQAPFQPQYPVGYQGQYPGTTGAPIGQSGWSPVVPQTSDGFGATNSFANGATSAPAAGFTPYSYNQPFFPGYSGSATSGTFNSNAWNPGFGPAPVPNFSGSSNGFAAQPGFVSAYQPIGLQPAFSTAPVWNVGSYPTSYGPGFQALGPAWGWPNALGGVGGTVSGFPVTNSYSNGTYQSGGYLGGGFSLPTYNGYATFPSNPPTAPGFPAWNQAVGGFPSWGTPGPFPGYPGANPFASGPFGPGAGGTGWFPGQATFPWYSQVNGLPYTPTAAAPSTRPGENTDGTSANQQPRGIQFNRDAA